jgi:hypothetical protein
MEWEKDLEQVLRCGFWNVGRLPYTEREVEIFKRCWMGREGQYRISHGGSNIKESEPMGLGTYYSSIQDRVKYGIGRFGGVGVVCFFVELSRVELVPYVWDELFSR